MITLKKIKYKNFLSTGNNYIEIPLNSHKTTLICGKNGVGKSTINEAIVFALFNKSFRKINKPQLVNSITGKNCIVAIEFSVGSNEYKVIRGIKPAIFKIYKNGSAMNPSSDNRDYQEILEKQILKMNYKTFCQIVIIGSANWTAFMELTPHARRQVIEDLLDIEIFSVMNVLLKSRINENKERVIQVDKASALLENTIRLNDQHKKKLKQQQTETIEKKEQEIVKNEGIVERLTRENSRLDEQIKYLTDQLKESQKFKTESENISFDILTKKKENKSFEKELKFYTNNDVCPECEQNIEEHFKIDKISLYKGQIEYTTNKIKELELKQEETQKRISEFQGIVDEIGRTNKSILENNTNISAHMQFIRSIRKEIESLKESFIIHDDKAEKEKLKKLNKCKELLINDREIFNTAAILLKDSGIKTQIIRQYVPVMNKLINYYLERMEFFCKFNINENFEEEILSRHRDSFSYGSLSQGERMRVNLAILFTWREIARMRNSSPVNLLMLDEIMDSSLDASGTEEFLNIITKLAGDNNVIIISHKADQISDKFDNVIEFEKVKNFSKMKRG